MDGWLNSIRGRWRPHGWGSLWEIVTSYLGCWSGRGANTANCSRLQVQIMAKLIGAVHGELNGMDLEVRFNQMTYPF